MNRRWLAAIPGTAALLCAAIMVYLIVQIDNTRKQLQQDGVIEFNFIQQVDHNFDTFAQALTDFQNSRGSAKEETAQQAYLLRYDILYSSFHGVGTRFLGHLSTMEAAQLLFQDSIDFVDRYESRMNKDSVLDDTTIRRMMVEARELSSRVYDLGLFMFGVKSNTRDGIATKMDGLYDALWAFGGTLVLASLLAVWLISSMFRRTASISASARHTQTQLSTALDEITVSDIARQAQSRFVAAASHDLRQPLHALGLYLAALKSHVKTEQGQRILESSSRSTEALNQLLNSMLDLSKLDAGVVDVNLKDVSLTQLFNRIHQIFLPKAAEKNLQLSADGASLFAHTDPVLFERIVSNLLNNALDYTESGSVSVTAYVDGDKVNVLVRDSGLGIPLHEQQSVFDEYYQLNNPERDRTKGLGLGLSIVKRLTRLLDIPLTLKSEPGKGSEFSLVLPAGTKQSSDSEVLNKQHADSNCLQGLSILVIDDESDVRDGMRTLLEQYRCDVITVDSADTALHHIIKHEWVPDLIVADYRLRDDQKGDAAIERVREEVNEEVPAMIVTGDTSPARLQEATASGFALLHKPVIANELVVAINHLIGEST